MARFAPMKAMPKNHSWPCCTPRAESTKDCYNYTRSISLQVTYNFNAKRSKYKGTGAGNDEKNRL